MFLCDFQGPICVYVLVSFEILSIKMIFLHLAQVDFTRSKAKTISNFKNKKHILWDRFSSPLHNPLINLWPLLFNSGTST